VSDPISLKTAAVARPSDVAFGQVLPASRLSATPTPTPSLGPLAALVGTPEPHPITVTSTQIHYSQTVILDLDGLSWPHVSVASLVPARLVPVSPRDVVSERRHA